ncbi:hypothetical protein CONPUDRAFT_140035 [Coniophora puteana RWD-64-598 SS2]|uniref:Uncharacterized protein n=1 Tax=Coniophora puteana (strain RWD-64-598) TaxID=741705 RepID=A0A5M3M939_CONPW|nr:uncharacterized protein CONPUDRAFT_140035 [Coniophora puteana RWD-64-598 SS2]EIW75613.1 hypothetical protein CONPUDRAFT_140035 [Coniophora puteana RWD-64-598 SS2]
MICADCTSNHACRMSYTLHKPNRDIWPRLTETSACFSCFVVLDREHTVLRILKCREDPLPLSHRQYQLSLLLLQNPSRISL